MNANESFISLHRSDDVRHLALEPVPEEVDIKYCLQQIEGWQTAQKKLPLWANTEGIIFPKRLSMEQCSSQQTASYKRSVVERLFPDAEARTAMADLTGGFGVDFSFIAPLFMEAVYVEEQPALCELARHNLPLFGLRQAKVFTPDSAPAKDDYAFIYLDPSRRNENGKKIVALEECSPNIVMLQEKLLQQAEKIMVKLSPMLDISPDKLVRFETAVMTVPQYDAAHPQMISQGPSVCVFNKKDPGEVLASWLFTQYLLTNEVQIAYAETEGYVPVTLKAQGTAEYKDYLSRGGEDNQLHYGVKIEATKLLIENTANTFTTPVFNGSASLRDAAGQMIENVTKSSRRNETIDEAYMTKLYSDITSLYRLSSTGTVGGGKTELGPLPQTAKNLLGGLAVAWVCIAAVYLRGKLKKKK